jgi:hypothetical protein
MSSFLKTFGDLLIGLSNQLPFFGAPNVIELKYPTWSNLAGHEAGKLLLNKCDERIGYEVFGLGKEPALLEKKAELFRNHSFVDLADMHAFLRLIDLDPSVWVHGDTFDGQWVTALLDEEQPQHGIADAYVARHPTWSRWHGEAGKGEYRDLEHVDIADLLIDNREDLEDPMLAKVVSAFRAAKTIQYDADLGDANTVGVKVAWKGSGGKKGAESEVSIPREFNAFLPAYSGPWTPGDEPRHKATFRLRVIPPDRNDPEAEPIFRLRWHNALDFELEAKNALLARIGEIFRGEPIIPVYSGKPDVKRFVLP